MNFIKKHAGAMKVGVGGADEELDVGHDLLEGCTDQVPGSFPHPYPGFESSAIALIWVPSLLRSIFPLPYQAQGLDNPAARLFSNPAGDYGSMVNERVGTAAWENGDELGDTWASRNAYSYGKG